MEIQSANTKFHQYKQHNSTLRFCFTFYILLFSEILRFDSPKVFYPLEKFFTPICLQILKLTTTILRCNRKKKAKSNASERISKPTRKYPHLEKWKTWIWCSNIRWPLSSSLIKKWVVNFTAEVTFLNFFAKAKGIMSFIHPCKKLVIPWANFF